MFKASLKNKFKQEVWLVTGACGYIGSHAVWKLAELGYRVIAFDNLSQGKRERLHPRSTLVIGDIRNYSSILKCAEFGQITGIFNFAGLKFPEESFARPKDYFDTNTDGVANIIKFMTNFSIPILIQSSSSSVYGDFKGEQISEDSMLKPISPYGESKLQAEFLINDAKLKKGIKATNLRFFNVVGARNLSLRDESERNLFPKLLREINMGGSATVYGNHYPTPDGTCVRDYIHIEDLIYGHILAAEKLSTSDLPNEFNLGTGKGTSVLEVIQEFQRQMQVEIKIHFASPREGDPSHVVANASRAHNLLKFETRFKLEDMVRSTLLI